MKLLNYKFSRKFVKNFLSGYNEFLVLRVFDVVTFNENLKNLSLKLNFSKIKFNFDKYKTQSFRRFFPKEFLVFFVGKFFFIFFDSFIFLDSFFKFFKENKSSFFIYLIFFKNRFFLANYLECLIDKLNSFNSKNLILFLFKEYLNIFFKIYRLFFFQFQKLNFCIKNGNN